MIKSWGFGVPELRVPSRPIIEIRRYGKVWSPEWDCPGVLIRPRLGVSSVGMAWVPIARLSDQ